MRTSIVWIEREIEERRGEERNRIDAMGKGGREGVGREI